MVLTNNDMVETMSKLWSISDKLLPQKISFAIAKNLLLLSKEYKNYEEKLKELLLSHEEDLQADENGKIITNDTGVPIIKSDCSSELRKEVQDLLDSAVEIEFHRTSFNAFDYFDNEKYDALSPEQIIALQKILCYSE